MLQEARLPLVPKLLCQLLYGFVSYVLPDMLCAGDLEDLKTVCEVCLGLSEQGTLPLFLSG